MDDYTLFLAVVKNLKSPTLGVMGISLVKMNMKWFLDLLDEKSSLLARTSKQLIMTSMTIVYVTVLLGFAFWIGRMFFNG